MPFYSLRMRAEVGSVACEANTIAARYPRSPCIANCFIYGDAPVKPKLAGPRDGTGETVSEKGTCNGAGVDAWALDRRNFTELDALDNVTGRWLGGTASKSPHWWQANAGCWAQGAQNNR